MAGFFGSTPSIVVFNLNTTGLGPQAHTMQISAKYHQSIFNVYILPKRKIEAGAHAVNKFVCNEGRLYVNGIEKATKPLHLAVQEFIRFLLKCRGNVILVAHNAYYHVDHLLKIIISTNQLHNFLSVCIGFSDTLPLFENICPAGLSLKLEYLNDYYNQTSDFTQPLHNAVTKCRALDEIMGAVGVTHSDLVSNVVQLQDFV